MLLAMADGWPSPNLNTLSMTDSSVLVVSRPQKEAQSFTTMPAPMTSLPLLIVPACGDTKDTLAKTHRKQFQQPLTFLSQEQYIQLNLFNMNTQGISVCPYYRGRDYMNSGFAGTKQTVCNIQ